MSSARKKKRTFRLLRSKRKRESGGRWGLGGGGRRRVSIPCTTARRFFPTVIIALKHSIERRREPSPRRTGVLGQRRRYRGSHPHLCRRFLAPRRRRPMVRPWSSGRQRVPQRHFLSFPSGAVVSGINLAQPQGPTSNRTIATTTTTTRTRFRLQALPRNRQPSAPFTMIPTWEARVLMKCGCSAKGGEEVEKWIIKLGFGGERKGKDFRGTFAVRKCLRAYTTRRFAVTDRFDKSETR